ncbi:unnamed protein product [Parnassius mnemosyne]|uniref:MADF domain-containing protein n=1 Tax=Parnassius mnemosyne TaxID=213953 RepID=A0AAV1L7E7_9NEOP
MAAEQEINIKFVQEVEKHACLYNYKLPEYMRKNTIDRTWAEIGNKFQITGLFCLYIISSLLINVTLYFVNSIGIAKAMNLAQI